MMCQLTPSSIGEPVFVVVIVFNQLDHGAAFPISKLERACANRMVVVFVVAEVGARIQVLRHHGEGACLKGDQEWAEGVG